MKNPLYSNEPEEWTSLPLSAQLNKSRHSDAITVWKDGSWKRWAIADARQAENDPDWLSTIPLRDSEPLAMTLERFVSSATFDDGTIEIVGEPAYMAASGQPRHGGAQARTGATQSAYSIHQVSRLNRLRS